MMISQYHITAGTQHLGASPNLTPKEKKKVMQLIKAWVSIEGELALNITKVHICRFPVVG